MLPTVTRQAASFRPDIEGLRGLAVLAVVLFHAGLLGVGGGFVGVDLFFVLSGFLITGLLLRERERTGRIGLAAFYARRIRRLVPAAAVVILATLAASWALLDPLTRIDALLDGVASALSVGNVRFALAAGDYFAPAGDPSPFLQFWSLGVEEQFYLVWPLLLLGALRTGRPRLAVGLLVSAVCAVSFAANLIVTDANPAWAFYSLPTRAWQLALGGLLAVAARPLGRLPNRPVAAVGWLGLFSVLAAAVSFDASMVYPGAPALVPALGAAALVLAGDRPGGPGRVLVVAPMRFLGRISYSLYLWHWPLLVLAPAATGDVELPLQARVGLVGLSVLAATATCLLIEEPIRFGLGRREPRRRPRPMRTITVGLASVLTVAVVGASLSVAGVRAVDAMSEPRSVAVEPVATSLPSPTAKPTARPTPNGTSQPTSQPTSRPTSLPTSLPAAPAASVTAPPAASPSPARTASPTAPPAAASPPQPGSGSGPALPPDVRPSLVDARSDEERLKADRCIAYEQAIDAPDCSYGNPRASYVVALVGDSHASHWFPALHAVAQENGWRLVPFAKVSCPFIDLPVESRFFKRAYTECASFRESTLARLTALKPALTIVAQNKWVMPVDPADEKVDRIGASLARTIDRVPGRVAILVDTPHAAEDVPECLAKHPTDIAACATPRARATWGVGAIEAYAGKAAGVPTIDLRKHVCVGDPCPAVVDRMIVYRDYHHLTATFARSLAPALDAALRPILRG